MMKKVKELIPYSTTEREVGRRDDIHFIFRKIKISEREESKGISGKLWELISCKRESGERWKLGYLIIIKIDCFNGYCYY